VIFVDVLCEVVDEIFPVEVIDAERAKDILLVKEGLSARDALHVAVMERYGVSRILSFDAGFDGWPDLERIR
jgi:predicted nucleic acid-binding protein